MRLKSAFVLLIVVLALVPASHVEGASDLSGYTICVDAGHGGHDPGAIGNGVREKDIALAIALKTAEILKKDGAKVVLTRDGDYFVTLPERVRIANSAGCDIFVSIHVNSGSSSATGFEVYHYYGSSKGNLLATYVNRELVKFIPLKNRGVREAGFYVIKYTKMPAILIETGFITNPYDVSILTNDAYQWKYSLAILHGIQRYFGVPVHDPIDSSTPVVENVRYGQHAEYFRLVVDLTKKADYSTYYTAYSNGYNLVIQVKGAKLGNLGWAKNSYGWYYRITNTRTVSYIMAKEINGNVIIVAHLNQPYLPYRHFTLSNPDRIVVDIYG
ncbi:N-acetylmuramoyl-L-alanine amidase [Thermococcus stetteri]|uniref:N-acetylmuramoyl-L-alanine amidase n=1 Tax=Thermococcus stetteri TaxID=49900 RepID=UPI001AE74E86|nr:N-acetylmuramoyl-L-alanine amidase [Thermococcus stetteri]MBP1912396.1 N-acetylmuramoyl-L-alanine amidase [Thermococcus stetteri]